LTSLFLTLNSTYLINNVMMCSGDQLYKKSLKIPLVKHITYKDVSIC
jgi:hypothetical protein